VKCLCLKNVLPCHKCYKFLILGAKPMHDVHQWEVSNLEVDTWLGGFDMTWDNLYVFVMTLWWEFCDLAWSLWVICCPCSVWSCLGPMLMRGNFLWKMLHFDHGYVTCLYVPFYRVGDACAQILAILLVYVSFLACCSALCIFEKHMLAFVYLIHALPTKWRKVPNSCF
jgi:hypothetical protein